jgi:hypothetical protein
MIDHQYVQGAGKPGRSGSQTSRESLTRYRVLATLRYWGQLKHFATFWQCSISAKPLRMIRPDAFTGELHRDLLQSNH